MINKGKLEKKFINSILQITMKPILIKNLNNIVINLKFLQKLYIIENNNLKIMEKKIVENLNKRVDKNLNILI